MDHRLQALSHAEVAAMPMKETNPPSAVRIGLSGWNYPPWRKVFYPEDLTHKRELWFASRAVDTIEINGSFYSLVRPESVKRWYSDAPEGFAFSVKGSRYITHMLRLRDAETALANFFASGILALEEKLGPILWQLPPNFSFDADRLARFFDLLPRTMKAASRRARKHDGRVEGRAYVEPKGDRVIRHTIEVRHPSFCDARFVDLLREHDIAFCVADTAKHFLEYEDVTSDFVYVRLHGDLKLYESGYTRAALKKWAARIEAWSQGNEVAGARRISSAPARRTNVRGGRDVYVYFDNDAKVRAPFDARTLRALLDGERVPRAPKGIRSAGEPARTVWPAWKSLASR
ncbi:MAG: DUF72 domain-containing protein [Polyangiaceae bacterium]